MEEENSAPIEEKKEAVAPKSDSIKLKVPKFTAFKKNPWMLATLILAVFLVIVLLNGAGGITGNAISSNGAGDVIKNLAQAQIGDIEIVDVAKESGLYKVQYSSAQGSGVVYLTLDGKNLVSGVVPLSSMQAEEDKQEFVQSANPKIELYVMTHCPYGTQAEKGFIPAINVFENLDAQVKFVHYFLHEPEETETPIQVCIREEQGNKFLKYLAYFLEDGDSDAAMVEAGVDAAAVQACIDDGRADDYYAADSAASQAAGVQGSPTLVINGAEVSSGRSAAAYAETICSAFTDESRPAVCDDLSSLNLESGTPSAGFGYGATTGAAVAAQC